MRCVRGLLRANSLLWEPLADPYQAGWSGRDPERTRGKRTYRTLRLPRFNTVSSAGFTRLHPQLDDEALTPARRRRVEAALAEEVTLLWQTDEVRSQRPRVVDEIRHGLWFFEQSLMRVSELLFADYRRLVPGAPAPFHFGTWIGGDLDGNPAAGPETIAEALGRARELALTTYVAEVRELAQALGVSSRLVEPSQ